MLPPVALIGIDWQRSATFLAVNFCGGNYR